MSRATSPAKLAAGRLEAADHRGSAAERDHRDAGRGGDLQKLQHLVMRTGGQHEVRGAQRLAAAERKQVRGGLPARVTHPALVVRGGIASPDDFGQGRHGRLAQPGRDERDLARRERSRHRAADAKTLGQQRGDAVGQHGHLSRIAPPPPREFGIRLGRSRAGTRCGRYPLSAVIVRCASTAPPAWSAAIASRPRGRSPPRPPGAATGASTVAPTVAIIVLTSSPANICRSSVVHSRRTGKRARSVASSLVNSRISSRMACRRTTLPV